MKKSFNLTGHSCLFRTRTYKRPFSNGVKALCVENQLLQLNDQEGWKSEVSKSLRTHTLCPMLLHNTPSMIEILRSMKSIGGLNHAVIGRELYSNQVPTANSIEQLGFDIVDQPKQSRYGLYHDTSFNVVNDVWKKVNAQLQKTHSHQSSAPRVVVAIDQTGELLRHQAAHVLGFKKISPVNIAIVHNSESHNIPGLKGLNIPKILTGNAFINQWKNRTAADTVVSTICQAIKKMPKEFQTQVTAGNSAIGIIGYNSLGKAIAEHFVKIAGWRNKNIIFFEKNEDRREYSNGYIFQNDTDMLINNSQIIISTMQTDVTDQTQTFDSLISVKDPRIIANVGSSANGFQTFLLHHSDENSSRQSIDPYKDFVHINSAGATLLCLSGLFPINETSHRTSTTPAIEKWLDSALHLASYEQALQIAMFPKLYNSRAAIMLCPWRQYLIIKQLMQLNPNDPLLEKFKQDNGSLIPASDAVMKIIQASDGEYKSSTSTPLSGFCTNPRSYS